MEHFTKHLLIRAGELVTLPDPMNQILSDLPTLHFLLADLVV